MSTQTDFFSTWEAKATGKATSRAAYDRETAAQQRGRVLKAIELAGSHGMTCDELAARWGVPPNQISGRFTELASSIDSGPWIKRVERDGKVICRATRSGKGAAVWVAIQEDYSGGRCNG